MLSRPEAKLKQCNTYSSNAHQSASLKQEPYSEIDKQSTQFAPSAQMQP